MKKIFVNILASLCIAAAGFAASLPDLGGQEVVIASENTYPPLQFVDAQTNEAIGFEYDVIAEIAKRTNFNVKYENLSWDAMIPAVSEGQFDVAMNGITIRDDRKEQVDFSDPYILSEMLMIVRKDEERFSDAASFAAHADGLIAAQPGTTPFYVAVYEVLDGDEANPRIKLVDTFASTVGALKAGDVDLILSDSTAANGIVAADPEHLKIIGTPLGSEEFGFIFPQGSPLVMAFNAAIADMKADGTLSALEKKWFLDYKLGE